VIVSDRGALPERVGDAGLKFRAGDAADLAKQIQEILDAPDLLVRMRRNIRPGNLVSMEAHVAMLEKIYEDAAHARKPKRKSHTPYLKLVAHAEQQVIEREEALSGLQQQIALSQARAQDLEAENGRLAQARQAAEAQRAELETRLATIAEEREQFLWQLSSRENARVTQVQELERMINHLTETRDELARRLTEMERTPAARLQAFLQRWDRPKGRNR
jgi:chromosome segregation ATPase